MKKLLSIAMTIILAFSIVSCANKTSKISQETLFFDNTMWGMTKLETQKALKLKNSDLEKISYDVRNYIDTYVVKDYVYNNEKCDILLGFSNDEIPEIKEDMLVSVKVNTNNKDFLETEREKLDKLFTGKRTGHTSEPATGDTVNWESTKTIKDFVVENKIPVAQAFYINGSETPVSTEYSEAEMLERMNGQFSKLSELSIMQLSVPDKDGYVGFIKFDGGKYAVISALAKVE